MGLGEQVVKIVLIPQGFGHLEFWLSGVLSGL